MKIGQKLILVIGLLTVISVVISGVVYYFVAKQSIEKKIEAQLETTAVLKENHINGFFEMKAKEIEAIAGEKALIDNFTYENVKQLLKERLAYKEDFFRFSVLNLDGKNIVSTDETVEGKIRLNEKYFIEGKKGTYIQHFYYDVDLQQPAIAFATPIKNKQGELIGVLSGRINLKKIADIMIERSGLGETGETYLVNKFNLLVSKSRFIEGIEFKEVIHTEAVKDCLKGNNGHGYYNNYRGDPVFGLYKWIPEREICLLSEISREEAFKPVKDLRNIVVVVCFGVFVLALILGFILARTIIKPIKELIATAQTIAGGDLTKRAEIKSKDEIGELAAAFNKMVDNVLNAEKEKWLLAEKYAEELEKTVKEKTSELQSKVKELGEAQLILQSLAEDIQEEKESVEIKVKERTKELSEEHGKLLALIESIKLGVIMCDLSLNIILANPAAKNILGKSLSETLTFKDLDEKMKDSIKISQALSYYVQTGKPLNIQEVMIEDKHYRLFMSPVRDIAEKIFIGAVIIIEDISEQKKLDKMRTEIVSITSHQLRTPSSVIKGNLEMILGGDFGEIAKEQKEILNETYLGNERMIKLINDLMDVTKIDEGKFELKLEPSQLEDLTAEIVNEILPFAKEKHVSLSYTPPSSPLPKVKIDRQRTKQVFQNLIDNAVKYSRIDSKGKVTVEVQKEEKFLKVVIKDNGIGIPRDEQDKMFERFFRGSNVTQLDPGGGSGLGLYIAKAIIEQSGGKIWFTSEEGKGTTFYITLPC